MLGEATVAETRAYGLRGPLARLFGVVLVSDIQERLCDAGIRPPLDAKRRRRLERIAAAGTLFVHVPKNAGTSIGVALYGQAAKHASIRWYARVAPDLVRRLPSFAVLRDPVERFLSAYAYARSGGGRDRRVSAPFREAYAGFRGLDDALDHVEAADGPYRIDHIFRPQNWYVTDWRGAVAVDRLVMLEDLPCLAELAPELGLPDLPHLNRGHQPAERLSLAQLRRLRRLYARDYEMVESLRARMAAAA
jgi:hypothetical protein